MKKRFLFTIVFLALASFKATAISDLLVFAEKFVGSVQLYDSNIKVINEGLTDFSKELGYSVSQAATQQNVWADAQIGRFFPSFPFHFGFGVNTGITHMNTSGIAKAADVLGIENIGKSFYFPVVNADLRIGGIFLPFDIGFSFIKLDNANTDFFGCNFRLDLYTIGFDVRYALIQEDTFIPCLSIGGGYFYNYGEFSADSSPAEAGIKYTVKTAYGQAQLSKKIYNIITPFVGVRGTVSSYDCDWRWKLKGKYVETVKDAAIKAGFNAITEDKNNVKSSKMSMDRLQPQLFAGFGCTFMCLQATMSVTADLRNLTDYGLWSGSFSFRVKF